MDREADDEDGEEWQDENDLDQDGDNKFSGRQFEPISISKAI